MTDSFTTGLTNEQRLAKMRRHVSPTVALLGLQLLEVDQQAGRARFSMRVEERFCNPMGSLQGGIVATILDDTSATALMVCHDRPIGVPTVEMKVSFFAPARLGTTVEAVGRCVKIGRRVAFAEADLLGEDGALLARLSTSALIIDMKEKPFLVERPHD